MLDSQWRIFFTICERVLGAGSRQTAVSKSWCAWTTFGSLADCVNYWRAGLPSLSDIGERGTNDSGPWGQPFLYQDLAHVIVPREFYWQTVSPGQFTNGTKEQDIQELSRQLSAAGISHRLTDLILEIKLY